VIFGGSTLTMSSAIESRKSEARPRLREREEQLQNIQIASNQRLEQPSTSRRVVPEDAVEPAQSASSGRSKIPSRMV
jgi:hypothetical protein